MLANLRLAALLIVTAFGAQAQPAPARVAAAGDQLPPISEAWQKIVVEAVPESSDEIFVLIHSAKDCPYCDAWKRHPSGLATAKKLVTVAPKIRMFLIDRRSSKEQETRAQYPDEVVFAYDERASRHELSPGVPLFEIYLRGDLVYRASGLNMWTERVLPVLAYMEKRRAGLAAPAVAGQPASDATR